MAVKNNRRRKIRVTSARSLQSILGGVLLEKHTTRHFSFLLFIAFIGLVYIGNSYYAEKKIRHIERLQKEVKELHYEHIYIKSKRVSKSRQSEIARDLSHKGIKESTVPPQKIVVDKKQMR